MAEIKIAEPLDKQLFCINSGRCSMSAVKNQCIRDANSIINKYYTAYPKAVLHNRKLIKKGFNNQNFIINDNCIELPMPIFPFREMSLRS